MGSKPQNLPTKFTEGIHTSSPGHSHIASLILFALLNNDHCHIALQKVADWNWSHQPKKNSVTFSCFEIWIVHFSLNLLSRWVGHGKCHLPVVVFLSYCSLAYNTSCVQFIFVIVISHAINIDCFGLQQGYTIFCTFSGTQFWARFRFLMPLLAEFTDTTFYISYSYLVVN